MTREDFSNYFDTQLNSYAQTALYGNDVSKADLRVDEYEKSLFLTRAQEEVVLSLYSGKNPYNESFESTEEMRRYLSSLVKTDELNAITTSNGSPLGIDSKSKFFTLPEDLWFITYESASVSDPKCEGMSTLDVYPVRQDEYHKIKRNPFRGSNYRRALRLDLSDGIVEIVSKYNVSKYYIRYLRKLNPIILTDLSDGLDIEGISEATDCELPDILHQRILDRAVILALQSKGISANTGQRRDNRE